MSENNERKANMWIDIKVKPFAEFENEEFEKLLKYAEQNVKNLLKLLYNENTEELGSGCRFGSAELKYFESAISQDKKLLSVFKLGELYGTIGCIGYIQYEKQQDQLSMAKFQMVTNLLPKLKKETEDVLKFLANKGSANEKELLNVVNVKLLDLMGILHRLHIMGFIQQTGEVEYFLSDLGHRILKQINKK